MDTSAEILQQLRWIRWLIALIAVWFVLVTWGSNQGTRVSSYRAHSDSFTDRATDLLNQGKAKEVISLVDEREKTYPLDPYVYWFRGKAYYQLGQYDAALKAISRADALCPLWRDEYTGPFIEVIEEKLRDQA